MMDKIVITRNQLYDMDLRYRCMLEQLPPHLQSVCPPLTQFLSDSYNIWHFSYYETEALSITGAKRWRMLNSPHALTLLRAYALQRLPANSP